MSEQEPTSSYNVQGKTVFLTGGGRGLGRCVVDALLAKGAKVVFCDVNEDTGKATESEFQQKYGRDTVTFLPCDVRNDQQFKDVWRKTVELLEHVDVCVNNAAIVHETNFEECILVNLSDPNSPARGVRWCTFCPESINTPIIHMTPEQVTLPFDQWQAFINSVQFQPPEEVAQGLMTLLEDDHSNGHAFRMYLDKGECIYHTMANNSPENHALCSLVDVSRRVVPRYVPQS